MAHVSKVQRKDGHTNKREEAALLADETPVRQCNSLAMRHTSPHLCTRKKTRRPSRPSGNNEHSLTSQYRLYLETTTVLGASE